MKVKMILPALTEAKSPFFRPVKYSLFPPLGLATLAAYLGPADEIESHPSGGSYQRPAAEGAVPPPRIPSKTGAIATSKVSAMTS